MMETIEPREFSEAYNFPRQEDKREAFVTNLIQPFKLVLLMGLSSTGKSTFLSYCKPKSNWTLSVWNRDVVLDQLFPSGNRIEKFYNYVDKFEKKALPEILEQNYRQLIVEGWMRMESRRTRYLSYAPSQKTACVVFDGPPELIAQRCVESGEFPQDDFDLKEMIKEKHETIQWPTFEEGFNKIIYINTFEAEGHKYLQNRLI